MRVPRNLLFYLSLHENCSQRHLIMAKDLAPLGIGGFL
jgi:hypothetical protein